MSFGSPVIVRFDGNEAQFPEAAETGPVCPQWQLFHELSQSHVEVGRNR
jgi:hypothetical protein